MVLNVVELSFSGMQVNRVLDRRGRGGEGGHNFAHESGAFGADNGSKTCFKLLLHFCLNTFLIANLAERQPVLQRNEKVPILKDFCGQGDFFQQNMQA